MKTLFLFSSVFLLLCVAPVQAQQAPRELFERARLLEERNTDLDEAIGLYDRAAETSSAERRLAAEAKLRAGVLHERLGRIEQAQQIFAEVVRQYADQTAVAERARARLRPSEAASEEDDGLVVSEVWTGPGGAFARPSPDGRLLSYVDWDTGNLAVYDRTRNESRHVTEKGTWADSDEYAEVSVWSPDGRRIAYSWFTGSRYELRIVEEEGGEPRTLYSNPETDYLWPAAWSQDGRTVLALFFTPDRTARIALVGVEDGSARMLKSLDWRAPRTASLSPDGRFIAYDVPASADRDERDIFLLAADGSREETVVKGSATDFGPVFTPDGRHLLFVSDRRGTLDLWALPVADGRSAGTVKLVKQNVGAVRPLGCTADGTYFYTAQQSMDDVYTADIDLASGTLEDVRLATERFQGRNSRPEWSPDGTRLAYLSVRLDGPRPTPVMVIRDAATGDETDLPLAFDVRGGRTNLSWSRGGDALFVAGIDEKGRRGVYRVDMQGRATLVTPLQTHVQEVWAAADERLVYLRVDEKRTDVVLHDLGAHEEEELYRSYHVHAAALSSDGRSLAFSTADELPESGVANSNALKVLDVSTGAARELDRVSETHEITSVTWLPDGRLLYFVAHPSSSDHPDGRLLLTAIGGDAAPYGLALPPEDLPSLRFHPDGARIAYTSEEASTEVWAVKNYLSSIEGTK